MMMNKESITRFREALLKANGNKLKMQETFKGISEYLSSSVSGKGTNQSRKDYLIKNPDIKEIHDWAGTVLVNSKYQLVNY